MKTEKIIDQIYEEWKLFNPKTFEKIKNQRLTMREIVEEIRKYLKPIGAGILERMLKDYGSGYEGIFRECENCKGEQKFIDQRPFHLIRTEWGKVDWSRAYYSGCNCGGTALIDEKLELDRSHWMPS